MGKRLGVTKSGRIMNPADRERKQMRMKELKRNKKERVKIRQAIVKSRDPHELIDHMEKLDDQEFDLNNELALNVIVDKRAKYRGAFIQIIALYRTEKDERQVKLLESMLHEYEISRLKKEQHYKAQLFSKSTAPEEIPLPSGMMAPNAAHTPYAPPPVPPQFHPTMKSGILKKTSQLTFVKKHKYPPGPPCGLPLNFYDDEEESDKLDFKKDYGKEKSKRVQFFEPDEKDDDYGPVDIPETMLNNENVLLQNQSIYSHGVSITSDRNLLPPGGIIPPCMAPLPPRMHNKFIMNSNNFPSTMRNSSLSSGTLSLPVTTAKKNQRNLPDEPNTSAIISAAPQVNKPTVDGPSTTGSVISAAPQMRNIKKETTRFVPTSLRVNRPVQPVIRKSTINGPNFFPHKPNSIRTTQNQQPVKSADEACDEFLREIEALL